jgi:hypothetical protein
VKSKIKLINVTTRRYLVALLSFVASDSKQETSYKGDCYSRTLSQRPEIAKGLALYRYFSYGSASFNGLVRPSVIA